MTRSDYSAAAWLASPRRVFALAVILACFALHLAASCAVAHPAINSSAWIKVQPDGTTRIHIIHDAVALALNDTPANITDEMARAVLKQPSEQLAADLAAVRERLVRTTRLLVDGQPSVCMIERYSSASEIVRGSIDAEGKLFAYKSEGVLSTRLPPSTRSVTVQFSEVLGSMVVTIDRPGREPESFPLGVGERSPAIEILLAGAGSPGGDAAAPGAQAVPAPIGNVFGRYVWMGFTHIIPDGLDHVLFILGLYFASGGLTRLLWQVTAFTLAHSVTLALGVTGVVRAPSFVEAAIAASIVFVAIENIAIRRVSLWRLALVFAFGLLHGLGIADSFRDADIAAGSLASALIAFNIGVELGQLTVLAAALLLVGWFRGKPWYRNRVAIPASIAVGAMGCVWLVQRL